MKNRIYTIPVRIFSCFLVLLVCCTSCRQGSLSKTHHTAKTGSEAVLYAKGFNIDNYEGYKILRIYSGVGAAMDTTQYVLLQKGVKAPEGFNKAQQIEVPVTRMVTTASSHIAMAEFAGVIDAIVGLGSFKYVNSLALRKNIADGKVQEIGIDGTMNEEVLITMKPELLIVMGNQELNFKRYATLTNAGIPVLVNSEWLERSPLGRAEWVKVMAALTNTEPLVQSKFDTLEREYKQLVAIGKKAKTKPLTITALPYKGIWNVPDGDSYAAKLYKDAGVRYKWLDYRGTGSLSLSFETVAPEALKADFWLDFGYVDSKKEIKAIDPRYADFKPFKNGNLYNNNNRVNDLGSNDYWESGVVKPQLILADLIKIFHPELLPDHQLVYYKQLK